MKTDIRSFIPQIEVLVDHVEGIYEAKAWLGYEKCLADYNKLLLEVQEKGSCKKLIPIAPVPDTAKIGLGVAERAKLREIKYEAEKMLEAIKTESTSARKVSSPKALVFETLANTYKPVSSIGNGGAGIVYKVGDVEGNEFALKFMPPSKISTEKLRRFKNEIGFCGKNIHKNIVSVLDSGFSEKDGIKCPFYVMPLYDDSLRKIMEKGIPREKILPFFSQLLDGVEAAHLKGVWHRDLKPENILFDAKMETLIIADFGIAHFEEDLLHTLVVTSHDARLANFQYAAPEQRRKGEVVNQSADIYALGLILNEMYTGKLAHGTGFTHIGQVDAKYGYLDSVVESMLKQSPQERPQSIDAVKCQLSAFKDDCVWSAPLRVDS